MTIEHSTLDSAKTIGRKCDFIRGHKALKNCLSNGITLDSIGSKMSSLSTIDEK